MMLPPLLQIGDYLISTDIISECFACDYPVCRGACCIVGESGAPLDVLKGIPTYVTDDEAAVLRAGYGQFSQLMGAGGRAAVDRDGFSVTDRDGDDVTPLVDGTQECAFCHFTPSGDCMCAAQMAGVAKPISCSLYPIRVRRLSSGMVALNLHRWDICRCAFDKGGKEGTRVYEFLEKPISDAFGRDLFEAMDAARRQFCP